jgi:hypothetical protein
MADRDPRGPDPDDWFADDRAAARRDRLGGRPAPARADKDDWIGGPRPRLSRDSVAASLPEGWLPIGAAIVVVGVLLIGGLALAGVFSGSKNTPAVTTLPYSAPTATVPLTTQSASTTLPPPTTTLKPGDTGVQVRRLQRGLASLGYPVGKVDGDYGTATTDALKQFQAAKNLTADGIFGAATKTAFEKALTSSG